MITLTMETVGSSTWFGNNTKEFDTMEQFKKFILNECSGINPAALHKLGKWGRVVVTPTHGLYSTIYKLDDLTARIWCEHYTAAKEAIDIANKRRK